MAHYNELRTISTVSTPSSIALVRHGLLPTIGVFLILVTIYYAMQFPLPYSNGTTVDGPELSSPLGAWLGVAAILILAVYAVVDPLSRFFTSRVWDILLMRNPSLSIPAARRESAWRIERKYGINSGVLWPRLLLLLPEEHREGATQRDDRAVTSRINLSGQLLALVAGLLFVIPYFRQLAFPFIVFLATLGVFVVRTYLVAFKSDGQLQEYAESMFDIFRSRLLKEYGLHQPSTSVAERDTFVALSAALTGDIDFESLDKYREFGSAHETEVTQQIKDIAVDVVGPAVRSGIHEYLRGPALENFSGSLDIRVQSKSVRNPIVSRLTASGVTNAIVTPAHEYELVASLSREPSLGRPVVINEGVAANVVTFRLSLRCDDERLGTWRPQTVSLRNEDEARECRFSLAIPPEFASAELYCRLEQQETTLLIQLIKLSVG